MSQRNTYREDEELEEQINFRDILRVGKYLKPYMAQVARILVVVISMSCIVVAVPYLTKIMIAHGTRRSRTRTSASSASSP